MAMKIMAATADELVPDCQDVYEARRIVACNDDNALLGSAQAGPQAIEKDDEKHKLMAQRRCDASGSGGRRSCELIYASEHSRDRVPLERVIFFTFWCE